MSFEKTKDGSPGQPPAFDLISDATLAELQLPRDPSELLDSGVMYCKFRDKDNVIQRFESMKAGF